MGFLAVVTAFARAVVDGAHTPECVVDRDGGQTATASHFGPPGDDAPPLPGDLGYAGDDAGAGAARMVAYQDPASTPLAAVGEKRIYARSAPGVVACEIWLKADGSVIAKNALGSLELGPDGAVRLGNATGSIAIDALGVLTITTPLGSFGAGDHIHSTPAGPSGPPLPAP